MSNAYLQRIFNWEWNHFMVREQPVSCDAIAGGGMYHGWSGAKCSIGIFIPDYIYKPAMEGNEVETLLARWPMLVMHMQAMNLLPYDTDSEEFWECVQLLVDLQDWHDEAERHGVQYMYEFDTPARLRLISIAREYLLCCPPF